MEQRLVSLQLAIIDLQLRADSLAEYQFLNSALGGVIEQTPLVFPVPPGVPTPPDMPIVQANNPITHTGINVSRSRVDIIKAIEGEPDKLLFESLAGKTLDHYNNVTIGRLGLIAQYILTVDEPTKWLLKTIVKDRWRDWEELLIRFNKKEKFRKTILNNMVQLQEVLMANAGKQERVLHVQLDINTPVVYESRLTAKDCMAIVKHKMETMIPLSVEEML